MYEPLHHKYRPQTFSQLVGQGAIAATLTNALTQSRIAPAYLFCGPRGTGKTSSARILAKSLNCLKVELPTAEPCGECDVCTSVNRGSSLDIVEIDAASNTGVDNIRELIERSQFAPVQCRYKVYVIDECHMLSTAAFNALLKTLEEPPDRVVFVLATTDPQRVLPTIISRCQRFDFRRIPLPAMIEHLDYIAKTESIAIAASATQLVAQISQGGLRDAESLLDQLSLQADEITVESVWDLVGAVPERDLLSLVQAITADDATALLERVRHLMDKGREPLIVLQSLVGFYRDLLIAKRAPSREDLVAITPPTWVEMTEFAQHLSAAQLLASQQKLQTSEVQVKNTTQPRLWLEVTLTGLLPSALGAMADLADRRPTPAGKGARPPAAVSVVTPPAVPAPIAPPIAPPTAPPAVSQSAPPVPAEPSPVPISSPAAVNPVAPPLSVPASSASTAIPSRVSSANPDASPSTSDVIVPPNESPPNAATPETAAPEKAASPPPPVDVDFGSLADLWTKVLAVLVPRGTQILMSQQGVLLGFDGVGAKVGFRSASLQKLAQSRVPNLEDAFKSVFQRTIKVSLEVVTPEDSPVVAIAEPAPAPPAASVPRAQSEAPPHQASAHQVPSQPPSNHASPPQSPVVKHPSANNFAVNGGLPTPPHTNAPNANETTHGQSFTPTAASSPPPQSVSNATLPGQQQPSTNNSAPPSRLDAPTDVIGFDQDQEKIKRFANFFNGQIVNLNEEIDKAASGSPKSSDPGPDVPF